MSKDQWGHGYWQGVQDSMRKQQGITYADSIRRCARKICLAISETYWTNDWRFDRPSYIWECASNFKMSPYYAGEGDNLIISAFDYIWRFEPFEYGIGDTVDSVEGKIDILHDCLLPSNWSHEEIKKISIDEMIEWEYQHAKNWRT